jgi:hypothetical protein
MNTVRNTVKKVCWNRAAVRLTNENMLIDPLLTSSLFQETIEDQQSHDLYKLMILINKMLGQKSRHSHSIVAGGFPEMS